MNVAPLASKSLPRCPFGQGKGSARFLRICWNSHFETSQNRLHHLSAPPAVL